MTKAQVLDLFCSNISPKLQRAHTDNRKGGLLKRLIEENFINEQNEKNYDDLNDVKQGKKINLFSLEFPCDPGSLD